MVELLERAGRVLIESPPIDTTPVEVLRGRHRRRQLRRITLATVPVLVVAVVITYAVAHKSSNRGSISPAESAPLTTDVGATTPPSDPASSPQTVRPLRGTAVEVTGYHIGDTAKPSTNSPDAWLNEDGLIVEQRVPDWIAVLGEQRVVIGYIKGLEFLGLAGNGLPVYGENGEVIGEYGDNGLPVLDLMTSTDEVRPDLPVGDGSQICVGGSYTVANGDIPQRVARKFDTSIAWLDYVNADTPGYDTFSVGLVIKIPARCVGASETPLPFSFTPVGMGSLPEGYSLLWARYQDAGDGTTFGMVRFHGRSDQPDLALLIRPWPDGASQWLDAGRTSWIQNGRTVVSDGEGNGSCLPDICSVGVQWDQHAYVSLKWIQKETAQLGPAQTLESLVELTSQLSDESAPPFVSGPLEFD